MSRSKELNRRYYLHRILTKKGILYSSREKCVLIPYTYEELPSSAIELRDTYNYSIQLILI